MSTRFARGDTGDDFHELNVRAELILTHFGVTFAFTGEDLQKLYATFGRNAAQSAWLSTTGIAEATQSDPWQPLAKLSTGRLPGRSACLEWVATLP